MTAETGKTNQDTIGHLKSEKASANTPSSKPATRLVDLLNDQESGVWTFTPSRIGMGHDIFCNVALQYIRNRRFMYFLSQQGNQVKR